MKLTEMCLLLLVLAISVRAKLNLMEGDMVLDTNNYEEMYGSSVTYDASVKHAWPKAIVPYTFHQNFSSRLRKVVAEAIKEFDKHTCVRFIPRTIQRGYLQFVDETDCFSFIGKRGLGPQRVSIGESCGKKGTVIHEMIHSLGFYHEQSRRDRDNYIRIFWRKIAYGYRSQFKKYGHGLADFLGEPYDFDSIMHYSNKAFGEGKVTIESIKDKNRKFGQRLRMSVVDIRQINKMYGCSNPLPPLPGTMQPLATKRTTSAKETTRNARSTTLPRMTKPLPDSCRDIGIDCEGRAKKGYCKQFWSKSIMMKDCKRSCRFC